MKASEFDQYTICYQGIRHYREAVVSHLREVLQTTYPDKWESMLQKPFGKQWSIVVTNAEIRRTTGELTAPIVDCADYLGVHNFYNLFDSYFEDLFPAVALQETDTRKEQKAAILRWVTRLCTMDSQRTKGRISSTKSPQEVEHAYPARSDYIAAESI